MRVTTYRARICYEKQGRLRFLSHLELMRAIERAVRRASLPYAITQGFHPHMKNAFCSALPVGVASDEEYFDLWLTSFIEPSLLLTMLNTASVSWLSVKKVLYVDEKASSLTEALTLSRYSVALRLRQEDFLEEQTTTNSEWPSEVWSAFSEALRNNFYTGSISIVQKGKTKQYDLDSVLWEKPELHHKHEEGTLTFGIRALPQGTLRIDSYMNALLKSAGLPLQVVKMTRLAQFCEDKQGLPTSLIS